MATFTCQYCRQAVPVQEIALSALEDRYEHPIRGDQPGEVLGYCGPAVRLDPATLNTAMLALERCPQGGLGELAEIGFISEALRELTRQHRYDWTTIQFLMAKLAAWDEMVRSGFIGIVRQLQLPGPTLLH